MAAEVHYFGIRHHGPGSAKQLRSALDELNPGVLLIEGPSDQSQLISLLGSEGMRPPVALLSFPKDNPEKASFWPFAVFSPEYQAILWAETHGVPAQFIDLPSYWEREEETAEAPEPEASPQETDEETDLPSYVKHDPIGELAQADGYEDGESWWSEVIEENPDPGPVFEAVTEAMAALREDETDLSVREAAREAHMRLEIYKAKSQTDRPIAVVCGAYHVPALQEKHALKNDRALLKGSPRKKMMATWAPWTSLRLASMTGYGAGVTAPGWYLHLWNTQRERVVSVWLVRIADALRKSGNIVSSASVIEAERLALALASVRQKSACGFEEIREAAIACLCFGESLLWKTIEAQLLIGNEVGEIPDNVPLAPLVEDLKTQQKKARLKPEALERELSLDLRSESGLLRSTLLHRLNLLKVPWGVLSDPGRSRGTFRERWNLEWKPEYAVELVGNLIYGPTIEHASSGKLAALLQDTKDLPKLANLVLAALTAQLPEAAENGVRLLTERASLSSDCLSLLETLPSLASILRYGEARATDTQQMGSLFEQIATLSALGMHYATHDLDSHSASHFRKSLLDGNSAIRLILSADSEPVSAWISALRNQLSDRKASRLLVGTSARLLYESDDLSAGEAGELIARQLSPGTPVSEAAAFFEGFFDGGGARLIYDQVLRQAVDEWLLFLDDEVFIENLPLMRRVFSNLDSSERTRLLDSLFGRKSNSLPLLTVSATAEQYWEAHEKTLVEIFSSPAKDPETIQIPD